MTKIQQRKLKKYHFKSELYQILATEYKNKIQNLDNYTDVMKKFVRDESEKYLQHKKKDNKYVLKISRLLKDSHSKQLAMQEKRTNFKHMLHINDFLNNLIAGK